MLMLVGLRRVDLVWLELECSVEIKLGITIRSKQEIYSPRLQYSVNLGIALIHWDSCRYYHSKMLTIVVHAW